MNKILKSLAIFVIAIVFMAPIASVNAINVGTELVTNEIELGNTEPGVIAAGIINVALTFLGILAVIIILLGGFKWMTAAGNEDQVAEAKKIIVAGVTGLIIIFASWGIANFVIGRMINVTGAT